MEKLSGLILRVSFVGFLCLASARARNKTVSEILDGLLMKGRYDSRLRPNYDGGPVEVSVGFWVLSIDTINVVDMDFSLDIFFRQAWKDERLDHGLNETMFLSNFVMDRIWMPDSYFVNAKHGSFHKVTTNNMMIMIMPGGLVNYNARITIKAACPMDLRKFPMDTQLCPLIIESYGYSEDHIKFKWEKDLTDGMSFVPSSTKMLPQYSLVKLSLSKTFNKYVVGNWSGIKATFTFERMSSYFLIHVYGPCALIVIISWVSFLLPRSSPPARVTLGVTSVLTVVTILNMLNNSMPKRCKTDKICSTQLEMMEFSRMEQELMISDPPEVQTFQSKWLNLKEWRKRMYKEDSILAVDEFSLILFPLSFGIFNTIYWISVVNDVDSTLKVP
ncbi:gamma-aminobutyric acid receptor subunit beta-1-like isoform X2 [Oculina patagonica]